MNKIIQRHKLPVTALSPNEVVEGKYRCERLVYRKINGKVRKDLPKKRCKHPALCDEAYCEKHIKYKQEDEDYEKRQTEYEEYLPTDIIDAAKTYSNLPVVTDLKPELTVARALLANFMKHSKAVERLVPVEMLDEAKDILKRYNEGMINSTLAAKRLRKIFIDGSLCDSKVLSEVRRTISSIKQLVDSIAKIEKESRYMLDYGQAMLLIKNLQTILQDRIEDKELLRSIVNDIKKMPSMLNEKVS